MISRVLGLLPLSATCLTKKPLNRYPFHPHHRKMLPLSTTESSFKYAHTAFMQSITKPGFMAGPSCVLSIYRVGFFSCLALPSAKKYDTTSPCAAAAKASMDCLNRHDYDRDSCLDYFQAYRDCKKTWVRIGLYISSGMV